MLKHVTRGTGSLAWKLLRSGRLDRLLTYGLLMTSDLARESIRNNGSFAWTDRMYANTPSGRFGVGALVDRAILRQPAARGMRNRFRWIQARLVEVVEHRLEHGDASILSVPIGRGRDVFEALAGMRARIAASGRLVRVHGLDLDPEAVDAARALGAELVELPVEVRRGSALSPGDYPPGPFDAIVNVGFANYLEDDELRWLYRHLVGLLRSGGTLLTHSTVLPPKRVQYLLELAEFRGIYRGPDELTALLAGLPAREIRAELEPEGVDGLVALVRS